MNSNIKEINIREFERDPDLEYVYEKFREKSVKNKNLSTKYHQIRKPKHLVELLLTISPKTDRNGISFNTIKKDGVHNIPILLAKYFGLNMASFEYKNTKNDYYRNNSDILEEQNRKVIMLSDDFEKLKETIYSFYFFRKHISAQFNFIDERSSISKIFDRKMGEFFGYDDKAIDFFINNRNKSPSNIEFSYNMANKRENKLLLELYIRQGLNKEEYTLNELLETAKERHNLVKEVDPEAYNLIEKNLL